MYYEEDEEKEPLINAVARDTIILKKLVYSVLQNMRQNDMDINLRLDDLEKELKNIRKSIKKSGK